ncbi:hypothetical protein EMMF5_004004 [Cystobasidiomycetes sp. EMM_F5]
MAENTSMVGNINEGRNGSEDIGNNAQDTLNGQRLLQAPSLETDKETHKLDVSSGKASIELGPVVVNEDGTLSRITNWAKMTERERATTMRVLVKRNRERLQAVKEREGAKDGAEASDDLSILSDTKRESHTEL